MLSCELSKKHNYYHQNMEVHLGIETNPSQYGVKDHTMILKPIKSVPALIPIESSNMCINTLERLDPQFTT